MSAPVLPGFTYLDHLGSGGFADVFLYEQQWPQQRVAVKVVRPDVPLTEREKQMFTAEANAMARLADHPFIVSVITAGVTADGGRPFLVMRYCPPPDLGVRVRSNPMRVMEAVSTGIKLASAIETAHRSGILHRDIKPSNVLVTTYHEPALTDFGIAGQMTELEGETEVRISYPWSPPELLDGRSNGSVASDVYSLGATVWHLLVGRSPFSIPNGDNSTRALSARILHSSPPSTQRSDVPPALDRLLQQCLAKQPGHRPQSAMELAQSLQRIEAAAGWPRTAIAVEGSRPEAEDRPAAHVVDQDPTVMKARSVVSQSQSGRRSVVGQGESDEEAPPEAERGVAGVVWAVLGLVAAVAVVLGLTLGGGRRDDDPERDLPTDPSTPASVVPEGLTAPPSLEGTRTPRGAVFRWSAPDELQPGDQWVVEGDTGGDGLTRTARTRLVVDDPGQVCLEVSLLRGSQTSPAASTCVPAAG